MTIENNTVTFKTTTKEYSMKVEEYARWLCLVEALDLIETKAASLKQDMTNDDFWVKPLAFQKYIEQRLETMLLDISREEGIKIIPPTTVVQKPATIVDSEEVDDEPTEEDLTLIDS